MGRTIQTATQTWIEEEKSLMRFTRALRRDDQQIMRELINLSRLHIAESSYAADMYPMDLYIISMLLEIAKKANRMELKLDELCQKAGIEEIKDAEIPDMPSLTDLLMDNTKSEDETEV